MRDCPNAKMRDLLPDLLHGRLPSDVRDEVRSHVASCDACQWELELLRRVRDAVPERPFDASRIVSVLPAYRARSPWRRVLQSPQLRIAAAIVVIAGSAAIVATLVRGPTRHETVAGPGLQQPSPVARAPDVAPPTGASTTMGHGEKTAVAPAALATGESLHDLSDNELRALLDELGDLQAVTPAEDDVVVPSLGRGGP